MGYTRERITCAVRTLSSITSQIFRCHGLDQQPSSADRLGLHDAAWWLLFIVALCAWFLLLFAPQRERLKNLVEREQVLRGHMQAEKRELVRLQRSIGALTRNDPSAWERAARGRLGWIEPGEAIDARSWLHTHNVALPAPNMGNAPHAAPVPALPLPRPQIPPLPTPPPAFGNASLVLASETIDPAALGLVRGEPPPLPAAIPPPPPPPHMLNQPHPHIITAAQPSPPHGSLQTPAYVNCRTR